MAHGDRAAKLSNADAYGGRRLGNRHWLAERSRRAHRQALSTKKLTHRLERAAAKRDLRRKAS